MNELLPGLYDHIEPVALKLAGRAATLTPADAQRAYLVDAAARIVASGRYRPSPPPGPTPPEITTFLAWLDLIDEHLEDFVAGRIGPAEVMGRAGGRLWEDLQSRDAVGAVYGHEVARALRGRLAGKEVLELGAGTGSATRRLAAELAGCERFLLTDVRASFLRRVATHLPGVPVDTALVDINDPPPGLGPFDVVFSTNCVHVARDLRATLTWLRGILRPGGVLVLGEGSHYGHDVPSPVSLILCLFDGWWDCPTDQWRPQPGFLLADGWLAALEATGFAGAAAERWGDRRRPFGGIYWAFAPAS